VTPTPVPAESDRWTAWDRFLESTPATGFMQSSWWADFRADAGFTHFGVMLKSDGAIVAGAMVLRRPYAPGECFYYVQEGPIVPEADEGGGEAFAAVLAAIDEHRRTDEDTVSHLRIEPRWPQLPDFVQGFAAPPFRDKFSEPRNTRCLDLLPPEEQIVAGIDRKVRYNIRLGQRHGVSVVEDNSPRGLLDFFRIYRRTTSRQAIPAKPGDYFRELCATPASGRRVSLFFAEYQGRRIATALIVYFGGRATYFFGGSLARDRHVKAPEVLQLEIIRRVKALGCSGYDFWGVAPRDEADHDWQRLSDFKRRFGGTDLDLVPTLDHVYDAKAYDRYLALHRTKGS
jgi:lipid II:glycine glycyltransferase (peptidoglycan interpeptide bridge formation enzyme)